MHLAVGLLGPMPARSTLGGPGPPSVPDVRARIGVAPQTLSLYELLTGEENLAFFGRMSRMQAARSPARPLGARVRRLADRRRDRVRHYSGGMKRRLNLAAALVHEPTLLLLDEPTVGVDPQSRNSIFDSIEALRRAGTTIVYTTHYMEEAARLCDRVAIIDHGKLLGLDTVHGLIGRTAGRRRSSSTTAPASTASRPPTRWPSSIAWPRRGARSPAFHVDARRSSRCSCT